VGLSYTLSGEGMFVEDALAHSIEEELGVVGALLGSDYVVRCSRTLELDVLVCEPEGREQWDSTWKISEGNGRPFPQEFEVIFEPGHGNQYTVHTTTS